jgi:hypothetical protein
LGIPFELEYRLEPRRLIAKMGLSIWELKIERDPET